MRPLSIALAIFALIAIYSGISHDDGMMLGLGAASLVSAALMASPLHSSSFFGILNGLFAVETVIFGIVNLIDLDGFWPQDYADYVPPRYLPLATALFIPVLYGISQFPFIRRMMKIADPFYDAPTPAGFHIRPFPPFTMTLGSYARLCILLLVLINQFQVALSVRLNFFQNDFGNAIQVADEAHRVAFWHVDRRLPADRGGRAAFEHPRVPDRLQLRAAMAAVDDRVFHRALADKRDALSHGARRQHDGQPGPAHFTGCRRFHQRQRHRHKFRQRRLLQLHDPSDPDSDEPCVVLDHPLDDLAHDEHDGRRHRHSRPAVLGGDPLRSARDGRDSPDRPPPCRAVLQAAKRGGEFPLRSRPHPRIWRADRALKGGAARDRSSGKGVRRCFRTS